jgi:ATP-dependent DNA ligase
LAGVKSQPFLIQVLELTKHLVVKMINCQLAHNYNPTRKYDVAGWYSSPKIDGVRCLFIPGKGLLSRTQKVRYIGLEHIESLCYQGTSTILDGELYIPGEPFDRISGIARDRVKINVADKQRMQFHVFAKHIENYQFRNTELMIESITESIPDNQSIVVPVPYVYIQDNPIAIQAQNQINAVAGFPEGTMLRHPIVAYREGRTHDLLKVKNFVKSDFTVTNFDRGTGKYRNSLGRLTIAGLVDGVTITAKVGTGFSDAERSNIWENQSMFLGRQIEVVYLGTTSGKSLRHPVFSNFI